MGMTQKENLLAFFRHEPHEWMPGTEAFWQPSPTRGIFERPMCARAGIDWFGCKWESSEAENAMALATPSTKEHVLYDVTEWEEVVQFPDLEAFDWAAAIERDKTSTAPRDTHVICETMLEGCWERLNALMGIEESMYSIMVEPEACDALFARIAQHKMTLTDKIMEWYKPEVITYHDDWGMQTGPFIPPELWREIMKPHTKAIFDHIHEYGVPVIFHCCGKYDQIIPEISEIGCDVLECQDINDIGAALEKTGTDMSYWVSPHGQEYYALNLVGELTEEHVREQFRRELDEWGATGVYAPHFLSINGWYDEVMREVFAEYRADHGYPVE